MSLAGPLPPSLCILMSVFIPVAVGTVPPRITSQNPEKVTAVLNSSVSLPCEVHAHPSPEVTWYKDGQALSPGEAAFLVPGGYTEASAQLWGRGSCFSSPRMGLCGWAGSRVVGAGSAWGWRQRLLPRRHPHAAAGAGPAVGLRDVPV